MTHQHVLDAIARYENVAAPPSSLQPPPTTSSHHEHDDSGVAEHGLYEDGRCMLFDVCAGVL
jgi:hypothetical protein